MRFKASRIISLSSHRHLADTLQASRRRLAGTAQASRRRLANISQASRRHLETSWGLFRSFYIPLAVLAQAAQQRLLVLQGSLLHPEVDTCVCGATVPSRCSQVVSLSGPRASGLGPQASGLRPRGLGQDRLSSGPASFSEVRIAYRFAPLLCVCPATSFGVSASKHMCLAPWKSGAWAHVALPVPDRPNHTSPGSHTHVLDMSHTCPCHASIRQH